MPAGVPNVSNNDAIAARNFAIEIDGTTIAQFTEVGGLTSEMDVTELKENGPDGKLIIKKIPGAHKTPTLTLKRAKTVSMEISNWNKPGPAQAPGAHPEASQERVHGALQVAQARARRQDQGRSQERVRDPLRLRGR